MNRGTTDSAQRILEMCSGLESASIAAAVAAAAAGGQQLGTKAAKLATAHVQRKVIESMGSSSGSSSGGSGGSSGSGAVSSPLKVCGESLFDSYFKASPVCANYLRSAAITLVLVVLIS
jgi:hypothetical protein